MKGINACGDTDNLDAKVVNVDIDLVVPCAADDLAGVVVNLNGDISVIVSELYVLDTGSYANAGKLIKSVLDVAESTDRTADRTLRRALLRAVSLRLDVERNSGVLTVVGRLSVLDVGRKNIAVVACGDVVCIGRVLLKSLLRDAL